MRAKSAIVIVFAALSLAACVSAPSPPVNSPAFVKRVPLPGQPGYLETIAYIANGLRYLSPGATFFVSPHGEMCFQGLPDANMNPYAFPGDYWCIAPTAVASVDAVKNDVTYVDGVRLWCRHSAPQCAHKIGPYPNIPNILDQSWIANSVTAEIVPYREEQAAIEHLIYLMGGDLGRPEPLAWRGNASLDAR
jgi:hypothetical protein